MSKYWLLFWCILPISVLAEQPSTVEQNIKAMDTDRDGQVTVTEVRAYLEAQHGKGYKQALLEDMETKAGLKSCASPFSKSLY